MAGKRCPFFFASAVIQNHKFPPTIPSPANLALPTLSSLRPFDTCLGVVPLCFSFFRQDRYPFRIFPKMADEVSCVFSLACCRSLGQRKKSTPHCLA